MSLKHLNLLLADDDKDDRLFFEEALEELPASTNLATLDDGEQLMQLLTKQTFEIPHGLFLDLNMPRTNGFECLSEIKLIKKLKRLPVILFSTSLNKKLWTYFTDTGRNFIFASLLNFHNSKK